MKSSQKEELKKFENYYKKIIKEDKVTYAGQILQRAAKKWPNITAFICEDKSITYSDLYKYSVNFTKRLQEEGLKPKDKAILLYENSIEFFIAYFGIWQSGTIIAPLNIFLQSNEVETLIDNAEPKVIVVSDSLKEKLGKYNSQNKIKILTTKDINQAKNNKINNIESFEIPKLDFNEMAALLYTSGTTGLPKGVMLSSKNIIINAIQGMSRFQVEVTPGDKVYCALPLFHSLPQNLCVWATTLAGGTAIIVPRISRKSLYKGLEYKPKMIVAVPALYGLFCILKNANFSNVEYFISGGEAISDKTRAYFGLIYGRKICNGYGLTETSPFISVDLEDYLKPTSNVGRPLVHIECKITNDQDKELSQGQTGILWVKGPNVMLGYYKNKKATEEVIKDGWFYTGDLAYIDKFGKIVIEGRHKDLIVSKGANIYPQEIENVLLSNNQVLQAAVIGVIIHNEEFPIAFIGSKSKNQEKLKEELYSLCKSRLALYKIPKKFIIKSSLPISATGKIDKKVLKKEYKKEE